ncbi:MAG: hypothetical protein EP335_00390 [Alphaproteobacteria bacterium]|nr:MAG: hypothetical protein EP335_00390 [Alphaproteobacteria bacterium]
MLGTALNRTWQQLLHPKFRSVFLISVTAAVLTLGLLCYLLFAYWPKEYTTGIEWLDTTGYVTAVMIGTYVLFPAIVTLVMGVLIDQIATAVEEEYYPHRVGRRKVSLADTLFGALKLMLAMIFLNALVFIPYVILLFTTVGAGAFILFIIVNGYLLGREYFEMVATRHMPLREVTRLRKMHGGKIFMGGAAAAALFAVPFLNILAPIVTAAVMTHIFQFLTSGERA